MRLAIKQAGEQGWLCEHMFVMSAQNREKNRATYFCGAYPSACGKTATAMLPGEKVVGDDIAYFRKVNGEFRAVNVEQGIFGIIRDVNSKDDPVIFKTLHSENEMIFSNVLTGPDNLPYWLGMGVDTPREGSNHSGPGWFEGKQDASGKTIPLAHSNARYTIRLEYLENIDPAYNDKNGVPVSGVIYGGRDSDTSVPVEESFNWEDGIILKACTLESETTSATLGKEGVRVPQMMANLDFISYSLGAYIQNNLDFVQGIEKPPRIYAMNYFLKDPEGHFCTGKLAKKVWLHWAERRVHGEMDALRTPMGWIPRYEDLKRLFREILNEPYEEEDYKYQFRFRCDAWSAKLERVLEYYRSKAPDCPQKAFDKWESTLETVKKARDKYGPTILPGAYEA
jgi:phosphoenolpyruvate carboxykinase (GTP)